MRLSDHVHWRVLPWEWDDVPYFWRDAILTDLTVQANLRDGVRTGERERN